MTVSTTTARNVKTANGVTTSFPFDFAFEVEGDLIVNRVVIATGVETLQVLTTDYTVTGGSGATGTIEMVSAPPALDNLVIERALAYTQSVDYQPNDPFPAEVNETALDRLTFLVQQVLDFTQRAIKLKKTTTLTNVVIPDPEVGKILVGKTTTEFENKTVLDLADTTVTLPLPVADGGTNAATAAAARTNLDVQKDLDIPSQAEAEAGTATDERVWTAQRVKQAIAALETPGTLQSVQVFETTATWTRPAGIKTVIVEVQAGGGGGGGKAGTGVAGGGGAGGYTRELIDVTGTASGTATVGAGGAGGASGDNNGVNGGTSSFISFCSATGGGLGGGSATAGRGSGGVGGAGTGGDINASGGTGGDGMTIGENGGFGGGSFFGGGGPGSFSTGVAAIAFGSGGSGGGGASNVAGGAGKIGLVVVWEYS